MPYHGPIGSERTVLLRGALKTRTKRVGIILNQEGSFSFGRKRKNGCKLASSNQIKESIAKTDRKIKYVSHSRLFPPIPL